MSIFFEPTTKVQRDRRIMRDTDTRMAKYSRRGVIFNLLAFLICVFGGDFYKENPQLTIVLTSVLLLLTLLRGFFLFRFECLYPRAPTKWRNTYFIVTLLGAIWWGTILFVIIRVLGFNGVTPLLVLYNIVFFSTTAHAFAPYQAFLSYYQFFGIVPAAVAAFWLGDLMSVIYGSLLFIYFLILIHQCRLISENYWEKLAASYALTQKAFYAEEAKRDGTASLRLSKEFLAHLDDSLSTFGELFDIKKKRDLSPLENKELEQQFYSLAENVHDFRAIVYKDIQIENKVFNIRHELQFLVSEFIETAEQKGIQIETSLSPTLPMRLKGDASRFAQVIKSLLSLFVEHSESCAVLIEVQFLREYEKAGELYVTFRRVLQDSKGKGNESEPERQLSAKQSLSLVVAKGLVEAMEGSVESIDSSLDDLEYRLNAKLDIADVVGQLDFHSGRFTGKSIMLVDSSPAIVDIKRQELDALGFAVVTETQHKRAKQTLVQSVKQRKVIENIIFYYEENNEDCVRFIREIHKVDELRYINKIIAATPRQQADLLKKGFDSSHKFFFVNKPVGLFELESTFDTIFTEDLDIEEKRSEQNIIIYTEQGANDKAVTAEINSLRQPCEIVDSLEALKKHIPNASAVVIPCDSGIDVSSVVDMVRSQEQKGDGLGENEFMPIIGISSGASQEDFCAFETGIDDYIDLSSNTNKTLDSSLNYWESLKKDKK